MCLFQFWFPQGKCLGVGLQGHMVILFLVKICINSMIQDIWSMQNCGGWFTSVHLLSCVRLFATPWTAACHPSLSIISSRSLLKLMSMESVMTPKNPILCRPLLLLPSIILSIRVFSNKSVLHIRWPKYWSFSFNISPSNDYFRTYFL